MPLTWDPSSLSPRQALQRLVEGNRRFREASGPSSARVWSRQLATEAQRPFAIILGCSDSRTPVELLLDEGFEDLVVAGRVAVVGAEYELETGAVHLLDSLPPEEE